MNKNGFSLIEIVFTIIIIGLAMGAITESFLAGSAKSVNIVNEETAVNVAKGVMAALNYCRNNEGSVSGGGVTGVCSAFQSVTWSNPLNFLLSQTQGPTLVNNECFYTYINAGNVNFSENPPGSGIGSISGSGSPTDFIQVIVQTGWFSPSAGSCPAAPAGCPGTQGSCPYVTLSTVYANYAK
ncbi:MAG: prepilin-type N-terminal cleavage/methylation domain-containing protein [Deltaproteobacteria bacterium]|jgi:prepilin-type N-terminal cleavage/methylation domain-containing protein|nr:prepilin-type N-terminal cleavage/methylation domain-containing protein [Deltaproteobacteria bacterium]